MRVDPLAFGGHDLVGRNGDRSDFLLGTRVLANFIGGELGAAKEFIAPLTRADGVCHQNQSGGLGAIHGESTDKGFTGTTGEHNHTGTAVPETICSFCLIGAFLPIIGEGNGVTFAIYIAGDIFSGPTQLHQGLLQMSALTGVHGHGGFIDALSKKRCHLLALEDFLQYGYIDRLKNQTICRVAVDL